MKPAHPRAISRVPVPALLIACAMIAGCPEKPSNPPPQTPKTTAPEPAQTQPATTQQGTASWYGPGFENKPTATGEPFNPGKKSAASPNLPLGSTAEVTNLDTGKKTEVIINDRGPHVPGRIIDLSQSAAEKIGMKESGKAPVKVVAKRRHKHHKHH